MQLAIGHGAGCGASRKGHKRRIELHPIANAHPSPRCGRIWRGRNAESRNDTEDRERLFRPYEYWCVRDTRRRASAAIRAGPPPTHSRLLRDRLENSLLAMHGVPPALVTPTGNAGAMREGFRQLLHGLIKNLGALVVEELQAKLDPAAALSFSDLRAGDIAGSARAFGSLVNGRAHAAIRRRHRGIR